MKEMTIKEAIKNKYYIVLCTNHNDISIINNNCLNDLPGDFIKIQTLTGEKVLKKNMMLRFHQTDKSNKKRYHTGEFGTLIDIKNNKMIIKKENNTIVEKQTTSIYNIKKDIMPAYAFNVECLKFSNTRNKYATDKQTLEDYAKYFIDKDIVILSDYVKSKNKK